MVEHKFSIADGIEVQSRQLADWQSKLKPEVYAELEKYAKSENDGAKRTDDIIRGTSLSVFIANLKVKDI